MRVYGVQSDGKFQEYVATPFQLEHQEAVLEDWLERNPDGILEDGQVLIIGRQVSTNMGSIIDLLALDREGDVVVLELKRDRTPRDVVAQALEYASFAEQLDTTQLESILQSYMNDDLLALAEYHRQYFALALDEAVAFNKDQRIVIVGQHVTPEIRQTSTFLRSKGIRVTCVEFSFFQSSEGTRLLSQEIVVGTELSRTQRVSSGSRSVVTREQFMGELDSNGSAVFGAILDFAQTAGMPIHWGTRGFSLNIESGGNHVAILFCYPPSSVYGQSIYTVLADSCGISGKTAIPAEELVRLREAAEAAGPFIPAGRELKCKLDRRFDEADTDKLLSWCAKVAVVAAKHGPVT